MNANELIQYLNDTFGLNQWPNSYQVDEETYARVCQYIFDNLSKTNGRVIVFLGKNNGIMIKNVELVMRKSK